MTDKKSIEDAKETNRQAYRLYSSFMSLARQHGIDMAYRLVEVAAKDARTETEKAP